MQRRWRRQWKRIVSKFILTSVAATLFFSVYSTGYANPSGGTVTTGAGVIAQNGNTMIITQTTDKLGINWQNFSIGAREKTQFIQPGTNSVVLNRVIGSNPTAIYGTLSANGKVFLINPNGVLFAPGAQVNVGGLLASTLNIADSDFNAGNYSFRGSGGSVINNGTITTANGYVALLGSEVKNQGVIAARQGTVALGAGSRITLDMNGDGLLNLAVDQAAMNASVTNHNLIQADGGTVIMTTGAKDVLLKTVVSNSGVIQAKSVSNQSGIIRLEGGTVTNSGTLDASGNVGQTGGTVKVLGETVLLTDNARLNASGDKGGGTILIGGNYQGQGPEQNATNTYVGRNVTINADAISQGNGGKVVVWANDTKYYGSISAKGGVNSGDGGNVETSGKNILDMRGMVDASAAKGTGGKWLLDPNNVTIQDADPDTNVTGNPNFTTTDDNAIITTGSIQNALNGGTDVTITTGAAGANSQAGDITVANAITWSSGHCLALNAAHDVIVNAPITATGSSASVTFAAGHSVDINSNGNIITTNGNVNITGSTGGVSIAGNLLTNSGNITITGVNQGSGNGNYGIVVSGGSVKSVENSQITLDGTGGTGGDTNYGVFVDSGIVQAKNGSITLKGDFSSGSGDNTSNHGILLKDSSVVESLGTATVNMTGVSGPGTNDNYGIQVDNSKIVSSGGKITLNGTSNGSGANGIGVVISGISGSIEADGNAQIDISGQGNGKQRSYGIWLVNGNGTDPQIKTTNGQITMIGTAGGDVVGYSNDGMHIESNALIQSTGTGEINIHGIGGSGKTDNNGLYIQSGKIESLAGGNIIIVGGGKGNSSIDSGYDRGIRVDASGIIQTKENGNISLTGTGASADNAQYNDGIYLNGGQVLSSDGNITMNGTGGSGSGTYSNAGFRVDNNLNISLVQSDGSGMIDIVGVGGSVGQQDNYGIFLMYGAIKGKNGIISLQGQAHSTGIYNDGIRIDPSASIQSSGNGTINIVGTGGDGTDSNAGIFFTGGSVSSIKSDIYLNGTGGTHTSVGIQMDGGTIQAGGNATLVASGGNFINHVGANAVSTASGKRWLIYSSNPAGNVTGGLGHDFSLYNTAYASGVTPSYSGNGFIYASPLNLSATLIGTVTKIYDGTQSAALTAANFQLNGLSGATGTGGSVSGTYDNKNVGNGKSVTVNGTATLSGVKDSSGKAVYGYNFDGALNGTINGDITQATLTAALNGTVRKTYDGTTNATLGSDYTLGSGFITGDNITLSATNGSYDSKNAGNRTVSFGGLSIGGSDAGNYNLVTTALNGSSVIDRANLTAALSGSVDKTYNGNTSATLGSDYTLGSGYITGDNITLSASGSYDSKNAGNRTVSFGGLSIGGSDAGNYNLVTNALNGSGVIDRANLTAALSGSIDKIYNGDTNASLGSSYTLGGGYVTGNNITLSATSGSYDSKNAGNRAVSFGGLTISGGDAGNYILNTTTLSGSGVIGKANLTVVLTGTVKKTYDGTTNATLNGSNYSLNGVIGCDAVTLVNATNGTYEDKNVGSGKSIIVNGLSLTGGDAGNYTVGANVSGNVGVIDQVPPDSIPTPTAPLSDHYIGAIVTGHDSDVNDATSTNSVNHSTEGNFHVAQKQGFDLTVILPRSDVAISNGRRIDVSVPRDILPCTDATLQITASQANGQSLPSWLSFDPQAVRFYGQPPTGFSGTIHVRITMRDTKGNETSAVFKLIIGTAANDQGTLQAGTVRDSTSKQNE